MEAEERVVFWSFFSFWAQFFPEFYMQCFKPYQNGSMIGDTLNSSKWVKESFKCDLQYVSSPVGLGAVLNPRCFFFVFVFFFSFESPA